jgi:hypothetical protein
MGVEGLMVDSIVAGRKSFTPVQRRIDGDVLRVKGGQGPSRVFPEKQVIGHLVFKREG